MQDLASLMLIKQPERRITPLVALKHQLFDNIKNKENYTMEHFLEK